MTSHAFVLDLEGYEPIKYEDSPVVKEAIPHLTGELIDLGIELSHDRPMNSPILSWNTGVFIRPRHYFEALRDHPVGTIIDSSIQYHTRSGTEL